MTKRNPLVMTFYHYLKKGPLPDCPHGDLMVDIRGDKSFPRTSKFEIILEYLKGCGACPNALYALNDAWESYCWDHSYNKGIIPGEDWEKYPKDGYAKYSSWPDGEDDDEET